jgi:hypothetical protein
MTVDADKLKMRAVDFFSGWLAIPDAAKTTVQRPKPKKTK